MASASLLPKSISPFRSNPPSPSSPPHFSSKLSFLSPPPLPPTDHTKPAITTTTIARGENEKGKYPPWWDPFDEEVDPDTEYGSLYVDGKQDEDARPPNSENPDNPYGFLKFPMGYAVEVASLGSKIRGDVRRCCCVVSGGVYENLLFFPTIQLLKYRYPGVQIDIITTARGKQTYELNKNVRWANVYDPDDHFPIPAEYTDMLGIIRNRFYDMILSTKLAGFGHGAFLFMSTARDRVSYVYPNVNAAGAELFLSKTFKADTMNLAEGGFHMYEQMVDWLGRPFRSVPRQAVPPLQVSISRKVKEVVEAKYTVAGVEKGKYIVVHGIESDSKASMQSGGDLDSLLPLQIWAQIVDAIVDNMRCTLLFVIPHEKERENVEEIIGDVLGDEISIVFITTPAQLAALINDSAGVIATNTAAIQLANARQKPSIGLFCSEEKAKLFVPDSEERKCSIVASKTGKLQDIDAGAVAQALQIFDAATSEVSLALA